METARLNSAVDPGDRLHYLRAAVLVAAAIAAYRLVALALAPYGLQGDEAQYWTWAQAPAFGYYSKPPMVAWLIAAGTAVCGDTPFCIRFTSPLIHALTTVLVFLTAERLYGARVGLWTSVVYGLLPGISFYAVAATTDTPLLLFWALGLYAFIRATGGDRWIWWLLAGVALGLGLLSKYNMAVFAFSAFLYLVLSPAQRRHLRGPRPYAALALGLVIYAPNLIWNLQHGFVSYQHTRQISHVDDESLSPRGFLEFFAAQFAVFGPIFFAVLLGLLTRTHRLVGNDRDRLLVCFIVPWLAVVLAIALLSRAHANWAIPAYVAGAVWVSGWLLRRNRMQWLGAALVINVAIGAAFYHYDALMHALGIELRAGNDPFKPLRGWDEAGREVSGVLRQYPDATLLTDHRMTTALLEYYARPAAAVKWNPTAAVHDHYELTTRMQGREGGNFLLVTGGGDAAARDIARHFAYMEKVRAIRIPIHRDFELALDVYLMRDFKGYQGR